MEQHQWRRWPPNTRTCRRFAASVIGLTLLVAGCGLESVTDEAEVEVRFTERSDAESGDIEREVGESAEVYGREATLVGVDQVDEFDDIDNEGYVVLEVRVRNASNDPVGRHRGDWTLELPDGRRVQTTPVQGQPQLGTGELEPDEDITGKVVFAVGDQRGAFFAVFMPRERRNDTDDRERIVWGFTVE